MVRLKELVYSATCILGFLISSSIAARNEGKFFHISDIHYDPQYGQGVYPQASSCAVQVDVAEFPLGNYDCDSPWSLVEATLKTMADSESAADFIVWTGDTPGALAQDLLPNTTVLEIIQNASRAIEDRFPNLPVFPAIGNHDNWPRHLLEPQPNAFRDALGQVWASWLADYSGALDTFSQGGYYVTAINANLSVISLNTAFYYYKDTRVEGLDDPAGQFVWLEEKLEDAENDGVVVYIVAHILPGSLEGETLKSFQPRFNERYLDILRRFSHVIKGQFYGHHHYDSFRVLYAEDGTPVNALYVQPSLTPRNATALGPRNPSFRVVSYDRATGDVLDIEQYYLDLANSQLTWELEYRATTSYGVSDLSPASLDALIEKFSEGEAASNEIFRRYHGHSTALADVKECDDDCRRYHFCAITNLDYDKYDDCLSGHAVRKGGQIGSLGATIFVLLYNLLS
ncbi:acid sphingomyelinase-like phosphodiesterase 3b [Diadema antillarum]|uniref:acid sphingomyelinase-like phosphodiesterase 3b n=1 Tax=Diadema antillarum TaxID=105358 RepID=UPI003A89127F